MSRVFSGLVLLILLIGTLTLAVNIQPVRASGTVYIRADGSIDPPTAPIYTADNITYTLTGNITSDADGIVIERNNIVVDGAGYTVTGSGSGTGTTLWSINNVTVGNMTIRNFNYGILLYFSSNNTLSGNNITANSEYGIYLEYDSSGNILSGNNITANNAAFGIYLFYHCSGNILSGNNITNNSWGIELDNSPSNTLSGNVMVGNGYNFFVVGDFLEFVDTSNVADGKPVYYFVNQSDMVVNAEAYPKVGYLGFVNCVNMTVQGLNLTKNGQGLLLVSTNDSKITGNNAAKNEFGIYLYSSSNSNNISGNNITNNGYGILLDSWPSNHPSSNNSVIGNNITNNGNGIALGYSFNNTIYHNNFINNTFQVYFQALHSSNLTNVWDNGYPSGGNYWSNYNGLDLYGGPYQNISGSDGIGDTPNMIIQQNLDHYPLMNEFPPPNNSVGPVADFTHSPRTPIANKTVTFDASISKNGWNANRTPIAVNTYAWDFGDGNATSGNDSTIVHSYAYAGAFNVTLTISDSENMSSTGSHTILVIMPTSISISTSTTSSLIGYAVSINGTLSDVYGNALGGEPIVLYYTFPGATDWFPMTSSITDNNGQYSVQWFPTATGTFNIMAGWTGNITFSAASSNVTLNSIPAMNQYIFSVESNSTISALAFDMTSQELSFTASGPSGTTGYAKVTMAKSLVSNITNIRVYLDNNDTEYSIVSADDSWLLTFNYTHSTHTVRVDLSTSVIPEFSNVLILFLLVTLAVAVLVAKKRKLAKPDI